MSNLYQPISSQTRDLGDGWAVCRDEFDDGVERFTLMQHDIGLQLVIPRKVSTNLARLIRSN